VVTKESGKGIREVHVRFSLVYRWLDWAKRSNAVECCYSVATEITHVLMCGAMHLRPCYFLTCSLVSFILNHNFVRLELEYLSRYGDSLLAGRSADPIPAKTRFSTLVHIILYNGYRVFTGGKVAGAWR
jgi:hypothetical protein